MENECWVNRAVGNKYIKIYSEVYFKLKRLLLLRKQGELSEKELEAIVLSDNHLMLEIGEGTLHTYYPKYNTWVANGTGFGREIQTIDAAELYINNRDALAAKRATKKHYFAVDELKAIKKELNASSVKMFCLMFSPESLNHCGGSEERLELQMQILERVIELDPFTSIDWEWNLEYLRRLRDGRVV